MRRYAVRWTLPAVRDLTAIREHIGRDDPVAAMRVAAAIREAVARLQTMPNRGRPGRVPGTRELVLAGLPWIAVYEVAAEQVTILRVLHGAERR